MTNLFSDKETNDFFAGFSRTADQHFKSVRRTGMKFMLLGIFGAVVVISAIAGAVILVANCI